jgi:serine protease AprX
LIRYVSLAWPKGITFRRWATALGLGAPAITSDRSDVEVTVRRRGHKVRSRHSTTCPAAPVAVSLVMLLAIGGTASAAAPAPTPAAATFAVDPGDSGSPSVISRIVGAQTAWAAGWTGKGVDVAVIDTGVARVAGLDGPGRVIDGPDLSFDAAIGAPYGVDAFGHGTFMAGIIAGRDAGVSASATGCATCLNASGFSTTAAYVGIAPESRIVNVKVGAANGATDVTQVIAAVNWVTQHAHDRGVNIRVLNLSYGADSAQPSAVDPLAFAVEQAWNRGIFVVASAGNEGRVPGALADPAYDPRVVAVGGLDPGTSGSTADDRVASFAQHGTPERPVDVIAPAASVVGLRVPGSFVDLDPANTGQFGDRFQRGSGTSQAAAVVSGVAALLAQRYPDASPDRLKALLTGSATALPQGNQPTNDPKTLAYSGHGVVNVAQALAAPLPGPASSQQISVPSSGTGSLDATRNGAYVTDAGVALTGQQDVFGHHYDARLMPTLQRAAIAWDGGVWNGSTWTGDGWAGTRGDLLRWQSSRWTGQSWAGTNWDGSRWGSARWELGAWTGSRWGAAQWSDGDWSGSRWGGSRWGASRWSSHGWE